jgi:hypothetical protein
MRKKLASRIMRTTIDIDDPILDEVRQLQRREGKPLGRLVSDLLARALAAERSGAARQAPPFRWVSRPMGARIDLADKHAVLDAMDDGGR